jgi:hypothetical protein
MVDELEFKARTRFYKQNGISVVARPPYGRAGMFKKASNLNYTYMISERVLVRSAQSLALAGNTCVSALCRHVQLEQYMCVWNRKSKIAARMRCIK